MTLPLALIAAVARNRVIGRDNGLPWRLPGDLAHFRATTMGKPVLMGRKTYQSIGRPLPGRFVIVLSGDPAFQPEGIVVAREVAEALDRGAEIARERGAAEIMVAGGGSIYALLIGQARRLYLTEVDLQPEGDTLFPVVDPALWVETQRLDQRRGANDAADFAFVTFDRRPARGAA